MFPSLVKARPTTRSGPAATRHRASLLTAVVIVTAAASWVSAPAAHAAPAVRSAPHALHMAVFGDSVEWGQGVRTKHKFWTTFGHDLQDRTGRKVVIANYSHSGAPLTFAHAGTSQLLGSCGAAVGVPGEVPAPSPAIVDCQIPQAAASGTHFDLVLMNGCSVDLGVFPTAAPDYRASTNVTAGTASIRAEIAQYCTSGLLAAVRAAHALPGHPKVVINGYFPVVSRATFASVFATHYRKMTAETPSMDTPSVTAASGGVFRNAITRWRQFTEEYATTSKQVIGEAEGSQRWATYSPSGIGAANAIFARRTLLWTGTNDQLVATRSRECKPYLSQFPECPVASIGHPDLQGQQRYRERLDSNPRIASWFPAAG